MKLVPELKARISEKNSTRRNMLGLLTERLYNWIKPVMGDYMREQVKWIWLTVQVKCVCLCKTREKEPKE